VVLSCCAFDAECILGVARFRMYLRRCDGSVKGVRFFECAPNYGSFVRPANVTVGDFPPLIDEDEDLGAEMVLHQTRTRKNTDSHAQMGEVLRPTHTVEATSQEQGTCEGSCCAAQAQDCALTCS
jgi:hypothetical protein